MKRILPDESATQAFARQLARHLAKVRLVTLTGDLGAGKTTLVRAILKAMGHAGRVKSPTFTLMESYVLNGRSIYHFDLYRLADPRELEYLGFEDYFAEDALCFVEWPDRANGWLPAADLEIKLFHRASGRELVLKSGSSTGEQVCKSLIIDKAL